jgi:hypothetical protein
MSTLDYAQRAKKITNKPEINLKISNKEKIMVSRISVAPKGKGSGVSMT